MAWLMDVPRGCCIAAAAACCASWLYVIVPGLQGPLIAVAVWGSAAVGILVVVLAIVRMVSLQASSHVLDAVNTALGAIPAAHGAWLLAQLGGFC